MIRQLLACLAIFTGVATVSLSQQQTFVSPPPPEARQLDALLGTWNTTVELHQPNIPPKVFGTWRFKRDGDGFMVIDEYRVFNKEGRTAYAGNTYRVYDPRKRSWTYEFTEPGRGPFSSLSGDPWSSGTSRIQGNEVIDESVHSGQSASRARFYDISSKHFACEFEQSVDGGVTWRSNGHVEAKRTHP